MRRFLVFRLYGTMAAWGDIAVGEQRPSTPHPSKSAILGLLAAALGIRRHEDDKHQSLADGYGYAVRVDAAGVLLRDYHTTQVPESTSRLRHLRTRRDETRDRSNLLHRTLHPRLPRRHLVHRLSRRKSRLPLFAGNLSRASESAALAALSRTEILPVGVSPLAAVHLGPNIRGSLDALRCGTDRSTAQVS